MARQFVSAHNYLINLDANQEGAGPYEEVLAFLRRSRINHVLTYNPRISLPIVEEFWANANCIQVGNSYIFQTRVLEQEIRFTEDDLRVIFNLGTVEQEGRDSRSTKYDASIIRGAFRRMGFADDLASKTLYKRGLFGRWRCLAHIVLVGLSNKRTTFDALNQEAQAQMVSLVFNKPYSFSKFFFEEFKKQITAEKKTRFLMYPRLVMMILHARIPALPDMDPIQEVATISKRGYEEFTKRYNKDPGAQDVPLFGAILNGNYPCPSDAAIAAYLGPLNEVEDVVVAPAAAANVMPPQEQLHEVVVQEEAPEDHLDQQVFEEIAHEVLNNPNVDPEVAAAILEEVRNPNDVLVHVEHFNPNSGYEELERDELNKVIESDQGETDKVVGVAEGVVAHARVGTSGTAEASDKGKAPIVVDLDAEIQGESSHQDSDNESDDDDDDQSFRAPVGEGQGSRKKRLRVIETDSEEEKSDEEAPLKRKRKLESLVEKETSKSGEGSAGTEQPQETELQALQRMMSEQSKKHDEDMEVMIAFVNKLSKELSEEVEKNRLLKVQIDKAQLHITEMFKKVRNMELCLESGKIKISGDKMQEMFENFIKWKAERDNQSGCKDDQLAEAPKDDDPNDDAAKDQVQPEVVV